MSTEDQAAAGFRAMTREAIEPSVADRPVESVNQGRRGSRRLGQGAERVGAAGVIVRYQSTVRFRPSSNGTIGS